MMNTIRPGATTDYAWRNVGKLGTGLGVTLLGLCRLAERRVRWITPQEVAKLVGKASSTVARDLHTLAERGIIERRNTGYGVDYSLPTRSRSITSYAGDAWRVVSVADLPDTTLCVWLPEQRVTLVNPRHVDRA